MMFNNSNYVITQLADCALSVMSSAATLAKTVASAIT